MWSKIFTELTYSFNENYWNLKIILSFISIIIVYPSIHSTYVVYTSIYHHWTLNEYQITKLSVLSSLRNEIIENSLDKIWHKGEIICEK